MHQLEYYRNIVGDEAISSIYRNVRKFYGKDVLHINSTQYGGGVAEMLGSLLPLSNNVGLESDWRVLRGSPDFFGITKQFHNALHGDSINLTGIKKRLYTQVNMDFSTYCQVDHDFVIVHDCQPLPLIMFYKKRQPWIWRCHVDLSTPNEKVLEYLKEFILRYDLVIVSSEKYKTENLPVEQIVVNPAIDPLSIKNMELTGETISKSMRKFGIPRDKPLITQISRFDKWKDPMGVIEIYKHVKKEIDCRLVLCGSMAIDDPEGYSIYEKIRKKERRFLEKKDIIIITSENNILVNSLQRSSSVVIQKSLREGFGLTVTEALWKEKPVVASDVGGIPVQIKDGETGFLVEPNRIGKFVERILFLLENPQIAQDIGSKGREFVINNFLITRLLLDYMNIFNAFT